MIKQKGKANVKPCTVLNIRWNYKKSSLNRSNSFHEALLKKKKVVSKETRRWNKGIKQAVIFKQ